MTDRAKGCFVAFSKDVRTDDAERITNAIMALRGVESVTLNIANPDDWMNRMQLRSELLPKIAAIIDGQGPLSQILKGRENE